MRKQYKSSKIKNRKNKRKKIRWGFPYKAK